MLGGPEGEGAGLKDRTEPEICKRLRSPGIDSKESIPPGYVGW
jgi:hypothetical protein